MQISINKVLSEINFKQNISFSKVYYDKRHIVTTFAFCSIYVRRKKGVKHALADFCEFYFSLHLDVYVINNLLIRFCLKDTIATE